MGLLRVWLWVILLAILAGCGGSASDPATEPEPPTTQPPSDEPPGETPPPTPGPVADADLPLGVSAIAQTQLTLHWGSVEDASEYRLYYAREPIQSFDNIHAHDQGDWLASVSSPFTLEGLDPEVRYYVMVTAVVDGTEEAVGSQVSATTSDAAPGLQPLPQEVRMIELINRARRDPEAEVARNAAVADLNQDLEPDRLNADPKEPLAYNPWLTIAARDHSTWMLDTNTFSHTGEGGSSVVDRLGVAGYNNFAAAGENISVAGRSNLNPVAIIDGQHDGLFESSGHRVNLLSGSFREIGVGQVLGNFTYNNGATLPSSMITQKFGRPRSGLFITGVVYTDSNDNGLYDVGEGEQDIIVSLNGHARHVYDAGIFTLPVSGDGRYSLSFAGGTLTTPVHTEAEVEGRNVKLDVVITAEEVRVERR